MHSQREGVSSFTFEFTHLEPLETVSLADFATSLRPFSHHDRPGFSPWDTWLANGAMYHHAETRWRWSLSQAQRPRKCSRIISRWQTARAAQELHRPTVLRTRSRDAGLRSWPGSAAQNATRTRRVIIPVVNRWAFESCHSHYLADDSSHLNILDFVTQLSARV